MVDGGVAQRNVAEKILKKQKLVIPVVAVVKDANHKPKRLIAHKSLVNRYRASILLANAEAHRFVINFQRSKRKLK